METGRWNGHVFTVSPNLIRGFTGLSITGASETKNKASGGQQYVTKKAGKPAEVNLIVGLNALTGCRVRDEAMALVEDARKGATNYFYVGAKKLMTCQMMLTEANVEEVVIGPSGQWMSASVKLTLKQSGIGAGGGSGVAAGGKRNSAVKHNSAIMAEYRRRNLDKFGKGEQNEVTLSLAEKIRQYVNNAKDLTKKNKAANKGGGIGGKISTVSVK